MIAALALALSLVPEEPTPLPSRIRDVTVYGSSALVRRAAEVPEGGRFVLQGLPQALDPGNVRVRCEGGDVVDVEVRQRVVDRVPSERVQELRDRLEGLQRDLRVLEDDRGVLVAMRQHLGELMNVSKAEQARDVQGGRSSIDAWTASWRFASDRLAEVTKSIREAEWKVEEQKRRVSEVQVELGRCQEAGSVTIHDVLVEVVAPGRASLDVEYLVGNTGWRPAYDLRASRDLSKVELTYRARVWQQTGEDWEDVDLLLSTARPHRGAQGPDAETIWLSLVQPQVVGKARASLGVDAREMPADEKLRGLGYDRGDFLGTADAAPAEPAPRPFASVESQGLSVHFRLAQKETIESRDQPTTVLVGTSELAITAERSCVPALDTTVWLRAKAKNTSPWVLLPGTAGVFFGADYVGPAELETVQTDQELTLHLGADPGITCERTQTKDLAKEPGFLSSKSSRVEGWKMTFHNHGTVGTGPDGIAEVIVRDVLPKSRDDRIDVEIAKADPKPSTDERWKADREEKGIVTWVLRVPPGEKGADLEYETEISFPKGMEIVRK